MNAENTDQDNELKRRPSMLKGTLKHGEITEKILKVFYHVYGILGYGFLEKVYENSMAMACRKARLPVKQQLPINVCFEGVVVGEYVADLLVGELVIVELKAVKATPYEVGLLLNFGPKPQHVRKVFDNSLKGDLSWHKSQ